MTATPSGTYSTAAWWGYAPGASSERTRRVASVDQVLGHTPQRRGYDRQDVGHGILYYGREAFGVVDRQHKHVRSTICRLQIDTRDVLNPCRVPREVWLRQTRSDGLLQR